MKRPLVFLIGLLLALALLPSLTPANAQRSGWTTPFEVSPPVPVQATGSTRTTPTPLPVTPNQPRYGSSWFPSIATGPSGSVHVVWYSGIATTNEPGSSTDLLMYRELRNGAWTPINNIAVAATGGLTVRNSIVMSRDGRLHVLFRSNTTIKHTSAPWNDAWAAASWSEPRTVSGEGSYYTVLGVDQGGRLHAFWSQGVPDQPGKPRPECSGCANLFYRYSDTGGSSWSEPTNMSNSPYGDNRPQVKVDSRDRVHVVWDQGIDWYAGRGVPRQGVYRRSDERGESWRAPVYFTVPGDAVQQTTLSIDAGNNPVVVYRTIKGKVYFQHSRDGGDNWSGPELVPGVIARDDVGNDLDQFAMASDGQGNVHLLMVGYLTTQTGIILDLTPPLLLHVTWNGSRWSQPEIVVSNELYPEWPALTISEGNRLHAVWYTRSKEDRNTSERARYRVWYSARQLNIPATAPLPLFTAVPTAEPTAEPTVAPPPPTATPLPAEIAQSPVISGPPTWEMAALPILAVALLPAIAIIVGVALFQRRRR